MAGGTLYYLRLGEAQNAALLVEKELRRILMIDQDDDRLQKTEMNDENRGCFFKLDALGNDWYQFYSYEETYDRRIYEAFSELTSIEIVVFEYQTSVDYYLWSYYKGGEAVRSIGYCPQDEPVIFENEGDPLPFEGDLYAVWDLLSEETTVDFSQYHIPESLLYVPDSEDPDDDSSPSLFFDFDTCRWYCQQLGFDTEAGPSPTQSAVWKFRPALGDIQAVPMNEPQPEPKSFIDKLLQWIRG